MSEPTPFLRPAEVAAVARDTARGYATEQALQDPPVMVTLQRRATTTGEMVPVTETPVRLIALDFANREAVTTGANAGAITYSADGTLLAWPGTDVKRNDRFTWQGQAFEVGQVYPEQDGAIRADVRLLS